MTTKVKQLTNNQFIITDDNGNKYFQSYDSIIVKQTQTKVVNRYSKKESEDFKWIDTTYLDKTYWNYSKTTSKYRNQFLGETTKETQAKIDSGKYILTDLNQ